MISGVVVEWKSEEFKVHLLRRMEHHAERAAFYEKECAKFKSEAADAEIKLGQSTFVQTYKAMEEAQGNHARAWTFFRFLADHLVPNEVYRLDTKDLSEVEAIENRRYW
jgi:hypothetical protein